MNRNILKIIAVISMLIDHIGYYLLDNNIICRIIGRLAFPIFAYFISVGMKKTSNRKKYILLLTIFALITQIPYALLNNPFELNTLFTFLIAIGIIKLIESYISNKDKHGEFGHKLFLLIFIFLSIPLIAILGFIGIIDYGILGVLLVVTFYFVPDKKGLIYGGIILFLQVIKGILLSGFTLLGTLPLWSILSIILLIFYNQQKGKLNLKYLFYIFYPTHFLIIWIITMLIS